MARERGCLRVVHLLEANMGLPSTAVVGGVGIRQGAQAAAGSILAPCLVVLRGWGAAVVAAEFR